MGRLLTLLPVVVYDNPHTVLVVGADPETLFFWNCQGLHTKQVGFGGKPVLSDFKVSRHFQIFHIL